MIKLFDICKISKLCIIVAFALVLDISFTDYSYAHQDLFANATMDAFNLGTASRRGDKETAQKILENNNVDRETAKKIVDRDITLCKGIKRCSPACKYDSIELQSGEICTFCPLLILIFKTVSAVGDRSATNFSNSIVALVAVAFAIWLAVECIKFVSSIKVKDFKDFAQTLVTKSFVVLVAIVILKVGVGSFYDILVRPVFNTALHMSDMMQETPNDEYHNKTKLKGNEYVKGDDRIKVESSVFGTYKNGLPNEMGISIVTTMTKMENRVRMLSAFGMALMCQSWSDRIFIFPKFGMLIVGFVTWILSVSIIVIVPFLMIDVIFQLGAAVALLPFAIGGYPFDYTKKMFASKVWNTFLNSAFTFLFTSVIVLILLGALQISISSTLGEEEFFAMFDSSSEKGAEYFAAIKDSMHIFSIPVLKLFFVFLLAWSVMNMGKEFASEFASAFSATNLGSQTGGLLGSMAKGAALKAATPVAKGASMLAKKGADNARRGMKRAGARFANRVVSSKFDKDESKLEKGPNGEIIAKGWFGRQHIKDANGNITTVRNGIAKKRKNGTREVTVTERIRAENAIIVTRTLQIQKKDENGNWVVIDSKELPGKIIPTDKSAEGAFNKDGSCNPEVLAAMLKGTSGAAREKAQRLLHAGIMEQRFSRGAFNMSNMTAIEESRNAATGESVVKYMNKKGEIIITKMKIRSDGFIETTLTKIDSTGLVSTLESDGVRNKMTNRLLTKGFDMSKVKDMSIEEVYANCKKDSSGKFKERVSFGYTDYYKKQQAEGADTDDFPQIMFTEDLQESYDENGNVRKSNFDRYLSGAATDRTDGGGAFKIDFTSGEDKDDEVRLNRGNIFKRGNSYDAREADMNFNFASEDSMIRRNRYTIR